nr:MAG TPA: Repressor protein CI [Caudoviricetes sp.]
MNKLKKYRQERNLKQSFIAQKIGVSQQTFSCYELGTAKPPLDTAKKLADIFGCSIEDIFFNNSYK